MAQQQPYRDQLFENAPRARGERDQRDRGDVRKNEQDPDRWREEFGTRAGAPDPAAPYAYGRAGGAGAGYGAPPPGAASGPYGMTDYGAAGNGIYDNTAATAYGTGATAGYGTPGTAGYGTGGGGAAAGGGQWGRDASGGRGGGAGAGGGDTGRNRNWNRDDIDMNRGGRDQK